MIMRKYAVGADVGGSHICSSVVEIVTGEVCTEPVTTMIDSRNGAAGIISGWCGNILETISRFGKPVFRIGMAMPGPFDYRRGISRISGVSKFEGIFGLNVGESIRAALQPEIGSFEMRYVNDASAFALGECLGGAAKGVDKVVAITLGTGVGSGFVDSGNLIVSGEDVPANGWVYCLPIEGDIADSAFSTRWIVRRYKELTGTEVYGAKEVAQRFADDEHARRLFKEYGGRLADFVSPLLKRFGAQRLVLGGNISKAYSCFEESLIAGLADNGCDVTVSVSELMDEAAMTGAASLFR